MTDFVRLTPEQERARKRRNLMLALALVGFIALVFIITLAKLKAGVLVRPL
ncbi:MAG: hypothetical protein JNJ73_04475 [Hyphomonadaceae bacterium]|nr:hypothetical protein [Hyphomonadaceae bacterium]